VTFLSDAELVQPVAYGFPNTAIVAWLIADEAVGKAR